MQSTLPYVRMLPSGTQGASNALFGFALPFLPDVRTVRWLSRLGLQERFDEALQRQIPLIMHLWESGLAACDLRYVGTDAETGVALGLLCRVQSPRPLSPTQLQHFGQERAAQVRQLYADFGYELLPLSDEATVLHYLAPFRWQMLGEIRRYEELLTLENAYTEFEAYLPHPWQWTLHNRQPLLEAMLQRQGGCLVSCYVEPTQLSPQEQAHLSHATSPSMKNLLWQSGPHGRTAYTLYSDYVARLRQPFLVRVSVATATAHTFALLERMLRAELSADVVDHYSGRGVMAPRTSGTGPVVVLPQTQQDWEAASRNLHLLSLQPWGPNEGLAAPGTARLRSLMDATEASIAFRLPVVSHQDVTGIPVRSLEPTLPSSSSPPPTVSTPPIALAATGSVPLSPYSTAPGASSAAVSLPTNSVAGVQQPNDLLGKTLGNYQLEAVLGRGGFGVVYRAKQRVLKRDVAVKVMLVKPSEYTPEQQYKQLQRFVREAQAIARLVHPHILPVYDYQTTPFPYMVMPYVAGGSLADELKAGGKRPLLVQQVLPMLQQLAPALDYVHDQKLIHRDIKPHNVLRYPDGRLMLSDFGIVQFLQEEMPALTSSKEGHPQTPGYSSPEQVQGLPIDRRSDLFSLGVMVYELLAGRRPFADEIQVLVSSPPPLSTFGLQVPPALEAVVAKALAKQPEQRFDSASALLLAFQAAL